MMRIYKTFIKNLMLFDERYVPKFLPNDLFQITWNVPFNHNFDLWTLPEFALQILLPKSIILFAFYFSINLNRNFIQK